MLRLQETDGFKRTNILYTQCWVDCNPLIIPNYMTEIVVSNVIHYITHVRFYNSLFDYY